jgi:hypothetical protein
MGNHLTKINKNAINFVNKYRDPQAKHEFKKYYIYIKQLEEKSKKKVFTGKFNNRFKSFNSNISSMLSKLKILGSYNVKKMNDFIQSPNYKKKYYYYKVKIMNMLANPKDFVKYFRFSSFKDFKNKVSYSNISKMSFSNFIQRMSLDFKKNSKKILFYILSIYLVICLIKYMFYRVTDRRQDKNLELAFQTIMDLKSQNEDLMNYNQELMSKIREDNNYRKK